MNSLPKVLIIEQPFDKLSGGGITLSNLFEQWDKEKLAVVCSGYLISEETNFSVCNKYYQIGSLEHIWKFPFNFLKRKYYSGPIQKEDVQSTIKVQKVQPSEFRMKLINNILYPFLNYFGIYNYFNRFQLSKQLETWLESYDPDIIYAQASSLQSVICCQLIQAKLNKPMVFHMMDDWPSVIKEQGLLSFYWYKKVDQAIKNLFENTSMFFSISDLMAEDYLKRYGKSFVTFHNPIEVDFWKKYSKKNYNLNTNPILLYAGRIGQGIDQSLKTVAQAIALVNESGHHKLTFALQTQEKPQWIDDYPYVRHNPFVHYKELPRVFAEADILILPYDFDDKGLNFIRLSMPTKVPEYLASGTPILFFAPESTALINYVRKKECGSVVVKNDARVLAESIAELLEKKDLRQKYSERGMDLAENDHNAEIVREKFQNALRSLSKVDA
jgi:glycosyltransferase involved in cell wall biosynthesis